MEDVTRSICRAAAALILAAGLSVSAAAAKDDVRPLAEAPDALQDQRAAAEAAAREFQYRCLQVFGHAVYCHCVNGRRPEGVDFDAFVLFTSRTREELGYERLGELERKLVDDTRMARVECVAAMGW
jgi:hypothetical protein